MVFFQNITKGKIVLLLMVAIVNAIASHVLEAYFVKEVFYSDLQWFLGWMMASVFFIGLYEMEQNDD